MIGKYLLPATSMAAFEYGQPADHTNTGNDLVRFEGPNITVGLFENGPTRYVMFANRDYRNEVNTHAFVDTGGSKFEKLSKGDGTWSSIDGAVTDGERKVPLQLAAGDGELYRWIRTDQK